jgi:hypothetical protein
MRSKAGCSIHTIHALKAGVEVRVIQNSILLDAILDAILNRSSLPRTKEGEYRQWDSQL